MNKYISSVQENFKVGYYKSPLIDISALETEYNQLFKHDNHTYNPFKIDKLQKYNPIYNKIFTLSNKNYNSILLNQPYHFLNIETVVNKLNERIHRDVFIKYSPLLDPLHYMVGKYEKQSDILNNLPYPDDIYIDNQFDVLPKINSIHNCSYVDAFFCYISSMTLHHHRVINCLDFYDSFIGIQHDFKFNVSDDIEYLRSSDFFNENTNKLYTLENVNIKQYYNQSRNKKSKLCISKTNHNISAISINTLLTDTSVENGESCLIYDHSLDTQNIERVSDITHTDNILINDDTDDNSSIANTSDSNSNEDEDDNEDEWETDDDNSSIDEDNDNQYAYIKNFPIQMICLEKCDGTLDELFNNRSIDVDTAASALFQVVMSLIVYQKMYDFTHNDLHTNNIMYIHTDIPYLYYKYEKSIYKVPTYGKIYKIIDFGRSIYRFNGVTYCSDSFGPGGDADTQYNCEPFFNDKKPRLEPNMSFDLCRLGCSIYDFIISDDLDITLYDELQTTIYRWCLDDSKKNILYKANGDERYPDFKLYKMIARTVHQHTPQSQLEFPFFKQFLCENECTENLIDINTLPVYT
jgi:hypothetical protein